MMINNSSKPDVLVRSRYCFTKRFEEIRHR
jgi:hypothetical protein